MTWRWTEYRLRVALLVLSVFALGWFFYLARGVLLPLLLGLIFILMVSPVVSALERILPPARGMPKLRRFIAIIIVYLGFLALVLALMASTVPVIISQGGRFLADFPAILEGARASIATTFGSILAYFSPDLRMRADEIATESLTVFLATIGNVLGGIGRSLTASLGLVIAFMSIPVWAFYILLDRDSLASGLLRLFPENMRADAEKIAQISIRVVGSYFRAQLLLGIIVGMANFIGMSMLGLPYAPLLGLMAGIGEMIPIIGPWLGAVPALLVALAFDPSRIIGVGLVALTVQMAENYLLVPKIQGWTLRLHPAVIIVLLILGSEVAGFWGILLIVPLTALFRDIFIYLYQRWSHPEQLAAQANLLVTYPVPEGQERVEMAMEVGERTAQVNVAGPAKVKVAGPAKVEVARPQEGGRLLHAASEALERESERRKELETKRQQDQAAFVARRHNTVRRKHMGGVFVGIIVGAVLVVGMIIWMIGALIT